MAKETEKIGAGQYLNGKELSLTLPIGIDFNNVTIKGFVWDSNLKPLSNAKSDTYKIELQKIVDAFSIPNQNDIRGNITLSKTVDGAQITWTSSDESIINTAEITNDGYDPTPAGIVNRNADEDKKVTLTAEFSYGRTTITKDYVLTVTKKPVIDELKGYLLAGFANNGSRDIQQIHFSLSQDGNFYSDMLNGGEPVIVSYMGTKGLRDPYIIRSPESDKFYMIATDLDASGGNWGDYSTNGSKSIMIWESTDLVNWSDQRMIKVAPDNAGNCWAPEAVYDPKTGDTIYIKTFL